MLLILQQNISYELILETSEGRTSSELFNHCNILQSREQALTRFLELTLDEIKAEEIFVTVYCKYLPTGQRIELVNTVFYESPGETLEALIEEVHWYQCENLAVNLAVYDPIKPSIIKIVFPQNRYSELLKSSNMALLIASQFWIFLGHKKQVFRYGNVF